jgi:hypothetical protein
MAALTASTAFTDKNKEFSFVHPIPAASRRGITDGLPRPCGRDENSEAEKEQSRLKSRGIEPNKN